MIGLEVVVVELIKGAADVAFRVVEVGDVLVINADDDDNDDATVVVEVVVVGGAVIGTLLWGLRLAELSEVPPLLGLSQGGRRSVNKQWIRVILMLQKAKEGRRRSKNPFDHLISGGDVRCKRKGP